VAVYVLVCGSSLKVRAATERDRFHNQSSDSHVLIVRLLRSGGEDKRKRSPRREVPEIRLSGLWLERVGFPKGKRYLMSADLDFETIYLQADPTEKRRRR